jgi:hypothetical protein
MVEVKGSLNGRSRTQVEGVGLPAMHVGAIVQDNVIDVGDADEPA